MKIKKKKSVVSPEPNKILVNTNYVVNSIQRFILSGSGASDFSLLAEQIERLRDTLNSLDIKDYDSIIENILQRINALESKTIGKNDIEQDVLDIVDLNNYAKKSYVDGKIESLRSEILSLIAQLRNDLNELINQKIGDAETNINNNTNITINNIINQLKQEIGDTYAKQELVTNLHLEWHSDIANAIADYNHTIQQYVSDRLAYVVDETKLSAKLDTAKTQAVAEAVSRTLTEVSDKYAKAEDITNLKSEFHTTYSTAIANVQSWLQTLTNDHQSLTISFLTLKSEFNSSKAYYDNKITTLTNQYTSLSQRTESLETTWTNDYKKDIDETIKTTASLKEWKEAAATVQGSYAYDKEQMRAEYRNGDKEVKVQLVKNAVVYAGKPSKYTYGEPQIGQYSVANGYVRIWDGDEWVETGLREYEYLNNNYHKTKEDYKTTKQKIIEEIKNEYGRIGDYYEVENLSELYNKVRELHDVQQNSNYDNHIGDIGYVINEKKFYVYRRFLLEDGKYDYRWSIENATTGLAMWFAGDKSLVKKGNGVIGWKYYGIGDDTIKDDKFTIYADNFEIVNATDGDIVDMNKIKPFQIHNNIVTINGTTPVTLDNGETKALQNLRGSNNDDRANVSITVGASYDTNGSYLIVKSTNSTSQRFYSDYSYIDDALNDIESSIDSTFFGNSSFNFTWKVGDEVLVKIERDGAFGQKNGESFKFVKTQTGWSSEVATLIRGDLVVDGTIYADKIVTNEISDLSACSTIMSATDSDPVESIEATDPGTGQLETNDMHLMQEDSNYPFLVAGISVKGGDRVYVSASISLDGYSGGGTRILCREIEIFGRIAGTSTYVSFGNVLSNHGDLLVGTYSVKNELFITDIVVAYPGYTYDAIHIKPSIYYKSINNLSAKMQGTVIRLRR